MKRALVLGKFAPLHRGHHLLIDTALAETDETIILIYDAPDVTDIPLRVRSDWLRALYPTAQVIEAWDGPTEVGYTPELMAAHERYIIETLGLEGITHLYSSEPYGEHMSRALGAVDRRIDQQRARVPVSATDIRREPTTFRDFVPPGVYRELIINVVFLGAPSTGKTTIAERMAESFRTCWMPEYGREYWENHQVDRRLTPQQLIEIAEGHLEREESMLARANRFLFTDTNAMTTETFARYYHGEADVRLRDLADAAARRYDLFFLCDTDIPYEATWDRSGPANRLALQRQIIGDLNARKVPYVLLRGTVDERAATVRRVLERFRKYMNPAELFGGNQ